MGRSSRAGRVRSSDDQAHALLEQVHGRVLRTWQKDPDLHGESIEESLDLLVDHVHRRLRGEPADLRESGGGLLTRRLTEVLRTAALQHQAEHPEVDPGVCLRLLHALDQLARAAFPDGARDFASRMADPDGLRLVTELAHDLRSPLTSISFLAETLRSGLSGPVTDLQHSQLGLIYSAALALNGIVADVVDLAEAGGRHLLDEGPTVFSIQGVFDSVADLVQPMAEAKGLELRMRMDARDRVLGHSGALGRVLVNLVVNGFKFTDHGWVEIRAEQVDDAEVEFSVRDTGRGLSEGAQDRLYQTFRRASRRDGAFFSSSGLGLSIVRRLLVSMDATLEFETRPHWGTRFHFRLRLPPAQID